MLSIQQQVKGLVEDELKDLGSLVVGFMEVDEEDYRYSKWFTEHKRKMFKCFYFIHNVFPHYLIRPPVAYIKRTSRFHDEDWDHRWDMHEWGIFFPGHYISMYIDPIHREEYHLVT